MLNDDFVNILTQQRRGPRGEHLRCSTSRRRRRLEPRLSVRRTRRLPEGQVNPLKGKGPRTQVLPLAAPSPFGTVGLP